MTEKTHVLLKKRRQVYVFIENLLYLVNQLKWSIDSISEHYTYLQGQWVKDYVIKNQMSRQKSTNAVESGLFKNLNNTLYGSLIVNTNKPEISTVVDGRLEFKRFHENISKDMNINPFACSEIIRSYENQKYKEEIVTASSLGEKERVEKEYRRHILYANAMCEKEKRAKRGKLRCYGPTNSSSKTYAVNESYDSGIDKILNKKNTALISSIEHIDDTYSIKTIVGNRKKNINVNTRYVGGVILMHTKISIASFIHNIMELFMEQTMSFDTKIKMEQMAIDNIYCSLAVTDTHSCSFQINGISLAAANQQTPSEDKFLEFIENTIYRELNHRIDTSSEYYDRFSLRDESRKKKMGLFALEQDGTNPIVLSVNANPKEYFELTQNHYVNKKHKGLARGTCGIDLKLYLDKVLNTPSSSSRTHAFSGNTFHQSRIRTDHNSIGISVIQKKPLAQINDKYFYTYDGILSFMHGHRDLEEYYNFVTGKVLNNVLQNKNIFKKINLEREALAKNKRLFTLYQIYNADQQRVINYIQKNFSNF